MTDLHYKRRYISYFILQISIGHGYLKKGKFSKIGSLCASGCGGLVNVGPEWKRCQHCLHNLGFDFHQVFNQRSTIQGKIQFQVPGRPTQYCIQVEPRSIDIKMLINFTASVIHYLRLNLSFVCNDDVYTKLLVDKIKSILHINVIQFHCLNYTFVPVFFSFKSHRSLGE